MLLGDNFKRLLKRFICIWLYLVVSLFACKKGIRNKQVKLGRWDSHLVPSGLIDRTLAWVSNSVSSRIPYRPYKNPSDYHLDTPNNVLPFGSKDKTVGYDIVNKNRYYLHNDWDNIFPITQSLSRSYMQNSCCTTKLHSFNACTLHLMKAWFLLNCKLNSNLTAQIH